MNQETSQRLSVVLLSYNGMEHLPECLDSLAKQSLADWELIVVDNGSTDGSGDYISRECPRAKLIRLNDNLGFCAGMNRGVHESSGEYVLLLNQDTDLETDCLEKLMKIAHDPPDDNLIVQGEKQNRPVLGVFPKITFYDVPQVINAMGVDWFKDCHWRDVRVGVPDLGAFQSSETVFGSIFPAVLVHRQRFLDIGAFDELFWSYCEDFDVCYRGNILGYRFVTAPDAVLKHKYRASSRDDHDPLWSRFWFMRNYLLVFLKNYSWKNLKVHGKNAYRRYLGNARTIAKQNGSIPEKRLCRRVSLSLIKHLPGIYRRRRIIQKNRRYPDSVFWRETEPIEDHNIFHVEGCPVLSLLSMRFGQGTVESYPVNDMKYKIR